MQWLAHVQRSMVPPSLAGAARGDATDTGTQRPSVSELRDAAAAATVSASGSGRPSGAGEATLATLSI